MANFWDGHGSLFQCSSLENPHGEEPGALHSTGLQKVVHGWSNLVQISGHRAQVLRYYFCHSSEHLQEMAGGRGQGVIINPIYRWKNGGQGICYLILGRKIPSGSHWVFWCAWFIPSGSLKIGSLSSEVSECVCLSIERGCGCSRSQIPPSPEGDVLPATFILPELPSHLCRRCWFLT